MGKKTDFKVLDIPVAPFNDLPKYRKGDLGEKCVELCFKSLCLELGIDFRMYPRSASYLKRDVPDFSDDVKSNNKTFEIEVKNLGLRSRVNRAWIEQNLPLYWFEKSDFQKVLIIFGGKIESDVQELLKDKEVRYIRHKKPVEAKDYPDLIWWLKGELLDVSSIRRRTIVALNRGWQKTPLKLLNSLSFVYQDNLFLTLDYDSSKSCFILRSFPKRDWKSEQEINEAIRSSIDGMHEWIEKMD